MSVETMADFKTQLSELTKRTDIGKLLTVLNEFAFEHLDNTNEIMTAISEAMENEKIPNKRLALFYLLDTFCKNRRLQTLYRPMVAKMIREPFVKTYQKAQDDITRTQLKKLTTAWRKNTILESTVLDEIEKGMTVKETPKRSAANLDDHYRSSSPQKRARSEYTSISIPPTPNPSAPTMAVAPGAPMYSQPIPNQGAPYSSLVNPMQPYQTPTPAPMVVSPEILNVINYLEQNLRSHPHLLPMLYDIKTLLHTPGADSSLLVPKVHALTAAFHDAAKVQQQQQAQAPIYQLPPSNYPPAPQQAQYGFSSGHPHHAHPPTNYPYQRPQAHPVYPPVQQPPVTHPHVSTHYPSHMQSVQPQDSSYNKSKSMTFESEDLKRKDPAIIESLYSSIPLQCRTCALRLRNNDEMATHLDWHFRLNRREARRAKAVSSKSAYQQWFWTEKEWLEAEDVIFGNTKHNLPDEFDVVNRGEDNNDNSDNTVSQFVTPADDNQKQCPVCKDPFDTYWDDDEETWMYRGTIRVGNEDSDYSSPAVAVDASKDTDKENGTDKTSKHVTELYAGQILHHHCYQSLLSPTS